MMIKEQATVTKIDGENITLTIVRKNECSKCGLCGMKKDENSYDFTVKSKESYVEGENVIVTFQNERRLTAIFFTLILPLIMLFVGVIIGYFVGSEILMIGLGLGLPIITFFMLTFVDKWFSKKAGVMPTIEKIKEK